MRKEPTFETIADLKKVSTLFLDENILFNCQETGNWYYWDKNSAIAEDNVFIVKPSDVGSENGRFVAVSGSVKRATSDTDVPSFSTAPPLTKIWWVNSLISGGKAVWLAVGTGANGWMRVNSLTNP